MNRKIYFIALTTYQLFVADVYSEYIRKNYNYDVKIITVGLADSEYNPGSGCSIFRVPDLNDTKIHRIWQRLYWAGRFFKLSKLYKTISFSGENIYFVFNDNEPITNNLICRAKENKENKVVIIEEGIGIYSYSEERKLLSHEKLRLMFTTILGSPMQYKALGDNVLIDFAVVGNVDLYQSLAKSKKQVVIQQSKVGLYKAAPGFISRYVASDVTEQKADILYLGQPFDEYGRLLDEEQECLEKLFESVAGNREILIKPHPRDSKEKYLHFEKKYNNVRIIEGKIAELPAECLISGWGVKMVISFNSSAGVNIANSFRDIKAIFLYKSELFRPVRKYWNRIGAIYDDSIFYSQYFNIVVPETDEEIQDCLIKPSSSFTNTSIGNDSQTFTEIDLIVAK